MPLALTAKLWGVNAGAKSTGEAAIAIGTLSDANGTNSTAVGAAAQTTGAGASAFGNQAKGLANLTTAVGWKATANDIASNAVGKGASATGNFSTALGTDTVTNGFAALSMGYKSEALARNAIATGTFATANTEEAAIAIGGGRIAGEGAEASGIASVAIGGATYDSSGVLVPGREGAQASNYNSIAIGSGADTPGSNATAVGPQAAVAIGRNAATYLTNQFVFGTTAQTYVMPGLTSTLSTTRQVAPTGIVTTNAAGELASDNTFYGASFGSLTSISSFGDFLGELDARLISGSLIQLSNTENVPSFNMELSDCNSCYRLCSSHGTSWE